MAATSDPGSPPAYVNEWFGALGTEQLASICARPAEVAVFCADMTVAFCKKGNLASARVGALVAPIADLFSKAYTLGVRQFVLVQDAHSPQATEFRAFAPHSIAGTEEASTVPELLDLSFSDQFTLFEKNSLHPAINTGFDSWLGGHPEIQKAIVVGNCTDFCVYHLAMYLRLRANALNLSGHDVIVPANDVDTYDVPAGVARKTGVMPHPGDFFHRVFLYHMAVNGIRIVRDLE